ncbi:uncharacterized protein LOC127758000 [Oryza glaberrima]|uniref:Hypothetical_protein n=1 Tax=Oryza glaberrima TaxID=4538 RepID=G2XLF5_ORYGL|nr:uncharacterized protein LOC127758000 [Oryza glaberrima]CBX24430.1 hypothetical_protein [Oryza glaberrima]
MKNMRLEEVSSSFILKPLEIHRPNDDSTVVEVFMDEDMLMPEMKSYLELVPCTVYCDDSYEFMVPHTMQPIISHRVLLPLPVKNLKWFGFNTSYQEFFERYHAYRTTHVPGTGPKPVLPTAAATTLDPSALATDPTAAATTLVPSAATTDPTAATTTPDPSAATTDPTAAATTPVYYDQITVPMKVFSRGLIMCVRENHKYGCLSDFDETNIFLRRGHVVILGVKLVPYSEHQAVRNFHTVRNIILQAIQGMVIPPDVQSVLDLLYKDPISSYIIIENNFAWMVPSRRDSMISELHENFSELKPDVQVSMTKALPEMDKWLAKFASNRLLFAVQTDVLPRKSVTSLEAAEKYFGKKAAETQRRAAKENDLIDLLDEQNPTTELLLYTGRRYFKGVRNSYIHLSSTSVKNKMGPLPIQTVDLVVSSQFAAVCSAIQVKVPTAFKGINEE